MHVFLKKSAVLVAIVAVGILAPSAIGTAPAGAFEYFEYCPAQECLGGTLYTVGVCDEGGQTFVVREDYWGNRCYQSFPL